MEWKDYDDFERKYGSDSNLNNFALRQSMFNQMDVLGNLLKSGLADSETIYNTIGMGAVWTWQKFKSVLEENRRRYTGKDAFSGLEYLANEMLTMKMQRDPSYKIPETFARYISDK